MSLRHIKQNPVYYLQHLREQAQLKKSQTTSFHNENSEKEQNFKLFFSGANENTLQKTKKTNESPKNLCVKKSGLTRKRWGTPTTPNILKEFQNETLAGSRNGSVDSQSDWVIQDLVRRFKKLSGEAKEYLLQKLKEIEE